MIRKSENRFSEKITPKQRDEIMFRCDRIVISGVFKRSGYRFA